MVDHVFVYGTLRPGDVRWHFLEPFAIDEGRPDAVTGRLFDTGFDYPAAQFDEHDLVSDVVPPPDGSAGTQASDGPGTIHGQTIRLRAATLDRALELLDDVEGVVDGDYRRVEVTTIGGVAAWAYACGAGLDLSPIESGDWFLHRPIPPVTQS